MFASFPCLGTRLPALLNPSCVSRKRFVTVAAEATWRPGVGSAVPTLRAGRPGPGERRSAPSSSPGCVAGLAATTLRAEGPEPGGSPRAGPLQAPRQAEPLSPSLSFSEACHKLPKHHSRDYEVSVALSSSYSHYGIKN